VLPTGNPPKIPDLKGVGIAQGGPPARVQGFHQGETKAKDPSTNRPTTFLPSTLTSIFEAHKKRGSLFLKTDVGIFGEKPDPSGLEKNSHRCPGPRSVRWLGGVVAA